MPPHSPSSFSHSPQSIQPDWLSASINKERGRERVEKERVGRQRHSTTPLPLSLVASFLFFFFSFFFLPRPIFKSNEPPTSPPPSFSCFRAVLHLLLYRHSSEKSDTARDLKWRPFLRAKLFDWLCQPFGGPSKFFGVNSLSVKVATFCSAFFIARHKSWLPREKKRKV